MSRFIVGVEWVLGLLVSLVVGSYVYTYRLSLWVTRELMHMSREVRRTRENDLAHLEARLRRLEAAQRREAHEPPDA
jgi:hypothetical protein